MSARACVKYILRDCVSYYIMAQMSLSTYRGVSYATHVEVHHVAMSGVWGWVVRCVGVGGMSGAIWRLQYISEGSRARFLSSWQTAPSSRVGWLGLSPADGTSFCSRPPTKFFLVPSAPSLRSAVCLIIRKPRISRHLAVELHRSTFSVCNSITTRVWWTQLRRLVVDDCPVSQCLYREHI